VLYRRKVSAFLEDVRRGGLPHLQNPTLVVMSTPCQGPPFFYIANFKGHSIANNGSSDDVVNNSFTYSVAEAAEVMNPAMLVFENVPGLLRPKSRIYLRGLLNGLIDLGYEIEMRTLLASDFGVPQHRERLFLIASKIGLPEWPTPTHGEGRALHYVTCKDAIGDISRIKSDYDECLYHPNGVPVHLFNHVTGKRMAKGAYISWEKPAMTVMASRSDRWQCKNPGTSLLGFADY
jgi:site-specific DNA-cytosine methylase